MSPRESSALRLLVALALLAGCGRGASSAGRDAAPAPIAVDLQAARVGRIVPAVEIVGTTRPRVDVVVRARVAGRLLALDAGVGDTVKAGQRVARLEEDLPRQALREASASLAAARAEAASAAASEAQARLTLQQARVEAQRYQELARRGIAARETAEQRATAASAAVQQAENQAALVSASRARVAAQAALVAQARERLSYVAVTTPISGRVLERLSEPGNVLAIGDGVLRVGDLSAVKVQAAVSELDLGRVVVGRELTVRLDAFPEARWRGVVERVSPQADPATRLVPIEVAIDNPDGRIGAGLLARMTLEEQRPPRVLVPLVALQVGRGPEDQADAGAGGRATLYTVGAGAIAVPRPVVLGRRSDGEVEVLEGLTEGERFVVRSARPLRPGAAVKPSALSGGGG